LKPSKPSTGHRFRGVTMPTNAHPLVRQVKRQGISPSIHGNKLWKSSLLLIDYLNKHRPAHSKTVIDVGCGWGISGIWCAKTLGSELYALYVVDTRALAELVKSHIFIDAEQDEYRRDLEGDATRYLNHVRELARRKGIAVTTEKSSGAVNVEIKNKVTEFGIDLLVIGDIPQIRSRRDELYNETERAMRSVPFPVLIVKGEDRIWDLYEALD